MGVTECFKRLKWGFIPVERIVDDNEVVEEIEKHTSNDDESTIVGVQAENYENQDIALLDDQEIEYRDEANRPWYRLFDEYEYRLPKLNKTANGEERKWYHWFDINDSPAQRKLTIKLDILLTFYSMAAYWVKYLDQTNLNNAYVGGLKEGINMEGNDLVNTQVMFTVGNIIFQIPFMYILVGLPLNFVLPTLDLIWSILTALTSLVQNTAGLKAIRFFIGVVESGNYLCYQYLFGTFFTSNISLRSMVFYFGQYLGILTSSLLAGTIERNLDGVSGLAAWKWIYIVDGAFVSIPVGLLGYYFLPGTPTKCYSIFLSDEEIRLLRKNLKKNHTAGSPKDTVKSMFDYNLWKDVFTSWEIYVLSIWNIFCWNNNNGTSGAYLLWLKSLTKIDSITGETVARYSAGKLQDLSALTPGLGLLWLLLTCATAEIFHCRYGAIIGSQVFNIIGNVILAVWDVPESAKWFAFCLQYFGWAMAPVLYSFQNDICRRDARKRAVTLVTMNILAQTTTAFTSVLVWKTVEAPRYLKGFTFTAACALALSLWTPVVVYFYKKQEKQFAKQNGIILYNSKLEPDFMANINQEKINHEKINNNEENYDSKSLSDHDLSETEINKVSTNEDN